MSSSTNSSSGIGITGALFLIFLVLKLAEVGAVAHWSWWWVTSPLWLPVVMVLPLFALAIFVAAVHEWVCTRKRMRSMMRE